MGMRLKMTLLSDTIFGNGISVPGGEDSSVQTDSKGFPYYKAGTFKGIFREELENYLAWTGNTEVSMQRLLGESGDEANADEKLRFHEFQLSDAVKQMVWDTTKDAEEILEACTYVRMFTRIDENGMVAEGSLRSARCIRKGLIFYSTLECEAKDEGWIEEVLSQIKWIGTKRNRGFGNVKIEVMKGEQTGGV